jgi:hypothetical protein
METSPISVGRSFNQGFEAFKANPVPAIVGFLIAGVISGIAGAIPCAGILITAFVTPPLAGGMAILALNLVNNSQPEIGDVFKGFQNYVHFLGVFWLLAVISLVAYIPVLIGVLLGAAIGNETLMVLLVLATGLVSLVLVLAVATRLGFVYFIVAEGLHEGSIVGAFKKSLEMTSRDYVTIFLTLLVAGLIAMAGALACGIGVLVTVPIAWCMFAALYNDLKPQLPAVVPAEEPEPEAA